MDSYGGKQCYIEDPFSTYKANPQMRRLKFLEIALLAASPRLHLRVRQSYDRCAPRLARLCRRSIWLSDLTHVALKPIEWLAEFVRWLGGIPKSHIDELYRR